MRWNLKSHNSCLEILTWAFLQDKYNPEIIVFSYSRKKESIDEKENYMELAQFKDYLSNSVNRIGALLIITAPSLKRNILSNLDLDYRSLMLSNNSISRMNFSKDSSEYVTRKIIDYEMES